MAMSLRPGFLCVPEMDKRLVRLMWQWGCQCRGRVQFSTQVDKFIRGAVEGYSAQRVTEWQSALARKKSTKLNGYEKARAPLPASRPSGVMPTRAALQSAATYVETPDFEANHRRSLNEEQVAAVEADAAYVRVAAGPGSGKTMVLTHRIVHMISNLKVSPSNILCITFTNKAAQELCERLKNLLGEDVSSQLTVGTIHSVCARMLRKSMQISDSHLDCNYVIYDDNDSEQVVKRILQEAMDSFDTITASSGEGSSNGNAHSECGSGQDIKDQVMQGSQTGIWKDLAQCKFLTADTPERLGLLQYLEKHVKRKQDKKKRSSVTSDAVGGLLTLIRKARLHNMKVFIAKKNQRVSPAAPYLLNAFAFKMARIYELELRRLGAADFDDLLYLVARLLHTNPHVLKLYRKTWKHALVDEFQDIDEVQYELVRLLSIKNESLFVVGDIDQAIYEWRGADASHMQYALERDFPEIVTLQLIRNYRSSRNILKVASVLLRNVSDSRQIGSTKPLNLLPMKPSGYPICIQKVCSPAKEADFIATEIQRLVMNNLATWSSFAVLYRTHAQSFLIESSLTKLQIPYRAFGSLPFYSRKEIKDVLSYLHLVGNHENEIALESIINTPPRGIGLQTLARFKHWASDQNLTLGSALQRICREPISHKDLNITSNTRNSLLQFWQLIEELSNLSCKEPIGKILEAIIERTNYKIYLERLDNSEKAYKRRLDRLSFLQTIADSSKHGSGQSALNAFLQEISLVSDHENKMDQGSDNCVRLMTLHAAKGLEFETVFIAGLQEDLLPLCGQRLDEERRLFYVGVTRAMQRLYLSFSTSRSMPKPSRFLEELIKSPELKAVN
eukprot:Gb_10485 [translate_table: standard]